MNKLENVLEELEMSYNCIKLSTEEYVNVDDKLQIINTSTEESVVRDILKEQVVKKYLKQSQFATEDDIYLLQQIIKKAESFY
ncbi:19113_t:CDS:2 [Cetraspora pellucida]|uniref:19113_t:CDS:1 n=1 Tax=Cetraspora pellucida TaxID=1433469 RepID=A0A9N9BT61_9GLOM|nr:19113_t:CDS:2 [Cetraspora pellucida]